MTKYSSILLSWIALFYMAACMPVEEGHPLTLDQISYDQVNVSSIWQHGVEGHSDSLIPYLRGQNPVERFVALQMFSNKRMEVPLLEVGKLLNDPVERIRNKAAFILGQSGASEATPLLVSAFDRNDSLARQDAFNSIVLEAVGKTGNAKQAYQIAKVTTYTSRDSLLTLGQARALFQFGQRGIITDESIAKMISFLSTPTYAQSVRYVAAVYLRRFNVGRLDSFEYTIQRTMRTAEDPLLMEQLAGLLPKLGRPSSAILQNFEQHKQANVRLAYLKALADCSWPVSPQKIKTFLKDNNSEVAYAAAQYFISNGQEGQAVVYREWAQEDGLNQRTQYALFAAALKHLPFYYQLTKTTLINELKLAYRRQKDPFLRAELIQAFAYDPASIPFLMELFKDESNPIFIRTKALLAIRTALQDDRFNLILQGRARQVRRSVLDLVKTNMESAYSGAICVSSQILQDEASYAKKYFKVLDFIQSSYNRLSFPEEAEASIFLKQAAEALEYTLEIETEAKNWLYPDTALLNTLTDSSVVEVQTSRGQFSMRLLNEEAPFTVSSFVKSVRDGYYQKKPWHRVVPNFVAQTGCPLGDGYGSGTFTIPTEPSERTHYSSAGKVGMASAGIDTESTQWFITYGPTPHLDGRYTLFAEIIEGMDVVEQLQVGDTIDNIKIKNES